MLPQDELLNLFDFQLARTRAFGASEVPRNRLGHLLENAGSWRTKLEAHALAVVELRLAMMLLPEVPAGGSYNQVYALVTGHLKGSGLDLQQAEEAVVERVIELLEFVEEARRGKRKDSWADLHYTEKAELLASQNNRCIVCGQKLDVAGGLSRPELDHVVPFALGGNLESNKRIICKMCNLAKGINLSFVNSDYVALNYFIKARRRSQREVRYWVFERDGSKCRVCGQTSHTVELNVRKIRSDGRFIFDNLETVCATCGGA